MKSSFIIALLVAAGIGAVEMLAGRENGSLVLTMTMAMAVIQGCVALAAITEVVQAKWLMPMKQRLLAVHPLMLVVALLLIPLGSQMSMYRWTDHQHGYWFTTTSFLIRSLVLISLCYLFAFGLSVSQGTRRGRFFAVFYLLSFVLNQSLVAFDWVMSLEHPWFSTLFGGYFFIEAVYVGIATGGLIFFRTYTGGMMAEDGRLRKSLWDLATIMFGFGILWVGMFYAQYLVIWYGNLATEVGWLLDRMASTKYLVACFAVLGCLIVIPFFSLLSRTVTASRRAVALLSCVVIAGVLIERFIMIKPVFPAFNYPLAAAELIAMTIAIATVMRDCQTSLPADDEHDHGHAH